MFTNRRSRHARRKSLGFTLIELAVVLGVLGIVTAGLWRLMSTSTQQTKDQATAQQQLALINAVKGYLADSNVATGGQALLTSQGAGKTFALALPLTNVAGSCTWPAVTPTSPADTGLCAYLPPGFVGSGAANPTTNPYGQVYNIQVVTGTTSANQGYSFMVLTSGGSTIPDADGGRISNLIGGDGGFLYSSTGVCGSASPTACGAMGAWSANVETAYGFSAALVAVGHVASQSFVATAGTLNYDWLARQVMPNDNGTVAGNTPFTYNTMNTDLFMGPYNSATDTYSGSAAPSIHLHNGFIDG
ncbi:MAG: prepilin-type N-terminal cleavage/methylation domain-containing protein, partial [Alphaproteobacteria bacterium]|nr:prepilin-type N-terminal cleavage/methylation domain-containing protein [Alphaproteobacteria bacterium]